MVAPTAYIVFVSPTAAKMLAKIDGSVRDTIASKVDLLETYPEARGKPLQGVLKGFYRIVAAGRYRVIYRVTNDRVDKALYLGRVEVVCFGIRKEGSRTDVYRVASHLVDTGRLS